MHVQRRFLLSFSLFISIGCHSSSSFAQSENQNSYSAFVSALSAMSVSANDLIQNERNAARREFVRQKVTAKVLAAFPHASGQAPVTDATNKISLADVLDEAELLCEFRWSKKVVVAKISPRENAASITVDHLGTRAQQDYINAVTSQLQALAAPSDASDIPSAIKSLFSSYQVDVAKKPSADPQMESQFRKSCEADLKEFDAAYYGIVIPQTSELAAAAAPLGGGTGLPDLSFFGPIGALFNTVAGIVQPVLTNFSNILNDARKRAAIKEFLKDDQHKQDIVSAGRGLARATSDYLFARRLMLAGEFAEQIALVAGNPLDLSSKEVKEACGADEGMYRRNDKGILSGRFRRCHALIWNHFEKGLEAALKTAASYDQIADTGNTTLALNKFNGLVAQYDEIVDNSAAQADLWKTVTQMLTFAGAVTTAFSQENLKKIEQAFDAVSKGK